MNATGRAIPVWLTDWQVAEDHILVSVGDTVAWELTPADTVFAALLFGDGVAIDLQLDTYAAGSPEVPRTFLAGRVDTIKAIWSPMELGVGGWNPAAGKATLRPVADTHGSWGSSAIPGQGTTDTEHLYGYLVTIATPR
ncbi:MAG: hypothetical protein JWQ43_1458 [Glaciihabitans sp.]|nr:hypothetical protein [Glaciihabitans sp.]